MNSTKPPRWLVLVVLCLVGFSTVIGRANTALGTGTADSRLFRYIGAQWRDGFLPYRDIWDNKPPGVFFLARIVEGAREPLYIWAAIEAVFVIGSAYCVYVLLKTLGLNPWSRWFGVMAVSLALNLGVLHHGDLPTELFLALPATAAALAFISGMAAGDRRQFFLGGLLAGIATLFKTPGLAPILALTATFLLDPSQRRRAGSRAASLGSAYLGFGIALAVPLAYFGSHGAGLEMLDATFTYNFHYGSSRPNLINAFFITLLSAAPIAPLFGLAAPTAARIAYRYVRSLTARVGSGSDHGELDSVFLFLLLWSAADFAGAVAGGRAYSHYLIAIVPSATVLAALSLEWALRNASNFQVTAAVVSACALYPLLLGTLGDARIAWKVLSEPSDSYFAASARLIRSTACPGDRLFSWDYLPGVAQATNLRPATIVASAHYLNDSPYAVKKFRTRILDTLLKSPPEFVVMLVQPREPHPSEPVQSLRAALQDLLNRSYTEDRSNPSDSVIKVFVRKDRQCAFGDQSADRGRAPHN